MKTGIRLLSGSFFFIFCFLSAFIIFSNSSNLLSLSVSSAHAASLESRLKTLKAETNRLMAKGSYVLALVKVKRYVYLTSKKYGQRHDRYASALQLQAKVYRHLKRPQEAKKYEVRAAAIRKNNQKFGAKRETDIKNRLAAVQKRRAALKAQMQKKRRQRGLQKKQRPKSAQRSPSIQAKKAPSRPGIILRKQQKNTRSNMGRPVMRPKSDQRRQVPVMKQKSAPKSQRTLRSVRRAPAPSKATPPQRQMRSARRAPAQPRAAAPTPAPRRELRSARAPAAPKIARSSEPGGPPVARMEAAPAPMMAPPAPAPVPARQARAEAEAEADKKSAGEAKTPENHTVVKVYYATDRQRTKSLKLASLFGGTPSDPKRISYGICEVSIPKGHIPGELESPSIWRFEFKENPDKHVVLLKVYQQEKKTYFRNLKTIINRSAGENAFIFIHGYNVSFSEAARRTAQITYDLGFDGAPVFYSWPSAGELGGYPTDEDNIVWAQDNVKQFLKDFVEKTDAKNIYLIAHSMGNRALTGALSSLMNEAPQFKKRFREIILAAPDINARTFRDNIAPKMIEASNNVTLYVSADDKALLASRKFHANQRAGEAGKNMIIFKGIDTIDATGLDASLLGHTYFAETQSIISDILAIFKGNRPAKRKTLKRVKTGRGHYWVFAK